MAASCQGQVEISEKSIRFSVAAALLMYDPLSDNNLSS
jgi:hypothetical protein